MDGATAEVPFIDNGGAPEFFADGLHDVDVIGHTCRFLLFQFRKSESGLWIKEPVFYARLPIDAVGPAIALTLTRAAAAFVGTALAGTLDVARSIARH